MKRTLFVNVMLLATTLLASCSHNSSNEKSCCSTSSEATDQEMVISDNSVFLLDSEWETYHNEHAVLSDFGGKVIVGAMIFTNCPSACPRIVADMKNIEAELTEDERNKVQFLLISMDPERDTPEIMQEFASDFQLNESWELIRSDKASTMEIAQVLNVKIKPLEGGGFDHSNIIHILNKNGEIAFQQQGLNVNPGASTAKIRGLING